MSTARRGAGSATSALGDAVVQIALIFAILRPGAAGEDFAELPRGLRAALLSAALDGSAW